MRVRLFLMISGLLFIILIVYLSFKGCSIFVSSIDGNSKSNMNLIFSPYHYDDSKFIWMWEASTDSYKSILAKRVDSLIYTEEVICGYSSGLYFIVDIPSGKLIEFHSRISIISRISKNRVKNIADIPSIAIN